MDRGSGLRRSACCAASTCRSNGRTRRWPTCWESGSRPGSSTRCTRKDPKESPALVAGWIKEGEAERLAAEAVLSGTVPHRHDRGAPDRFARTGTVVPVALAPTSTATVPAARAVPIEMPAVKANAFFGACRFSARSAVADASDREALHRLYVPPGLHDDREHRFGVATVGDRCRPWCIDSTGRYAGRYTQRHRRC